MPTTGRPAAENGASYQLLELEGSAEELDIATALLLERGCLGTEESDVGSLRAYFPEEADLRAVATELRGSIPAVRCAVTEPIPDRDWLSEWKRDLEGFPIGSRYFVLPTWKPDVDTTRTVLRIDPEQAFGTGTHETTRLSVELVEDYVNAGSSVIDVGTGTGILAMVAAREGASSVLGIDVDPAAVACARMNVERNGLSEKVRIEQSDWESLDAIEADVVVANISTAVLERAVDRMYGTILLSGILVDEVDALGRTVPGKISNQRTAGEWAALVVERPRHG